MNKAEYLTEKLYNDSFQLLKHEKSESFGDYCMDFINDIIVVRISGNQSFESIDVCKIDDQNEKFDIALIKAMLQSERNLKSQEKFEMLVDFFIENLNEIIKIFNNDNYTETKKHLNKLQKCRVNQMFPKLKMYVCPLDVHSCPCSCPAHEATQ